MIGLSVVVMQSGLILPSGEASCVIHTAKNKVDHKLWVVYLEERWTLKIGRVRKEWVCN